MPEHTLTTYNGLFLCIRSNDKRCTRRTFAFFPTKGLDTLRFASLRFYATLRFTLYVRRY